MRRSLDRGNGHVAASDALLWLLGGLAKAPTLGETVSWPMTFGQPTMSRLSSSCWAHSLVILEGGRVAPDHVVRCRLISGFDESWPAPDECMMRRSDRHNLRVMIKRQIRQLGSNDRQDCGRQEKRPDPLLLLNHPRQPASPIISSPRQQLRTGCL
jgi:hypothetical protein